MTEQSQILNLIDTLKYITFSNFSQLDSQYFLRGATISEIDQCEGVLGHSIPSEVWQFWSECGGERGHLGVAMGMRVMTWQESMKMVLDDPQHFHDDYRDATYLPMFQDESFRALVAVSLETGGVCMMSYPDNAPHTVDLEMSFEKFLQRVVGSLVDNRGYYTIITYIKYSILVGDGSFLRYLVRQKYEQDQVMGLLQSQSFGD